MHAVGEGERLTVTALGGNKGQGLQEGFLPTVSWVRDGEGVHPLHLSLHSRFLLELEGGCFLCIIVFGPVMY